MYLTFFTYTCKHKENIRCKFISLLYIYTLCHQCKSSNSLRYLCTHGKLCEYSAMLPCHPLQTWCKSINLQYLKKYVQRCENIKFATHLHHLYNICKCMFLSRDCSHETAIVSVASLYTKDAFRYLNGSRRVLVFLGRRFDCPNAYPHIPHFGGLQRLKYSALQPGQ